jgi:beta-glucosidase
MVKRAMIPYLRSKFVPPAKRGVAAENITEMGWEVYPEGIYHLLKKFNAYPQIKKIIVTENGAAFPDTLAAGRVADPRRQQFIENYLGQVLRAKEEGVRVDGYFIWTMMDNFEWAEGYHPRFGLIHVDFATQQRTVKDSGYWFRDFLAGK